MHPQLELLLQIQDLRAQRQELAEGDLARDFEVREFGIDVDAALGQLDAKIDEIHAELEPRIRTRLDRMTNAGRPVVPLINGVCYGCFTSIPTADASLMHGKADIRHCDNCGRFLYTAG
jgi:predicted  nucleic acid-binding Zn-ribbon protein